MRSTSRMLAGGVSPAVISIGNEKNGVQRTIKSKLLFHVVLCIIIVLCSMSTHALYDESSVAHSHEESFSGGSNEVWEYIAKKYSSSGRSLTPEELRRMIKSMQKCDSPANSLYGKQQQNEKSSMSLKGTDALSTSQTNRKYDAGGNTALQMSSCKKALDGIIGGKGDLKQQQQHLHFNQSSFEHICPTLLYYIENSECCNVLEDNMQNSGMPSSSSGENTNAFLMSPSQTTVLDSRQFLKKEKPTSGEVWGYGFLLVTIISCSSLVGVSLMPFMAKDFYKHLLTVMIGLAVGSLTGSAVFHLLPQALRLSDHDPDHGYLHISLVIVGGIWLFFMIERILKFIMDYKERKGKNWKREKMSSVLTSSPESSTIAVMTENGNLMKGPLVGDSNGDQRNSLIFPSTPRDTGVIYECQEQAIKASFGHQEKPRLSNCHDHQVTFEQGKDSVIATVAWMIIFGDGLHNFIDGLSIGAAFNESIWTGVSISVAVLCEELPHELGDFAVLLNAGMSMRQAVTYNFLSACTCYIGMAVGILLGEVQASSYIFALAGGMFLYISLVDMVPEMNEIAQETSKISVRKGFLTLLLQNVGLFAGITALYLLALYQDSFQF